MWCIAYSIDNHRHMIGWSIVLRQTLGEDWRPHIHHIIKGNPSLWPFQLTSCVTVRTSQPLSKQLWKLACPQREFTSICISSDQHGEFLPEIYEAINGTTASHIYNQCVPHSTMGYQSLSRKMLPEVQPCPGVNLWIPNMKISRNCLSSWAGGWRQIHRLWLSSLSVAEVLAKTAAVSEKGCWQFG